MKSYSITIQQGNETVKVHTVASGKAQAVRLIMEVDKIPARAIKYVVPLKANLLGEQFNLN